MNGLERTDGNILKPEALLPKAQETQPTLWNMCSIHLYRISFISGHGEICLPKMSTDGFEEASAMFALNLSMVAMIHKVPTCIYGLCNLREIVHYSFIALSRNDIQMKNLGYRVLVAFQ